MIATSGFLTALECTKFVFGRDSRPGPRWGSLQRSPRTPSWFKGPTFKGRERRGREGIGRGERGKERGREGKGKGNEREGEERGMEGKGRREGK